MTRLALGVFFAFSNSGHGTGGRVIFHQSDLQSWARCPEAYHLEHQGHPSRQLSATAYGSVMHHALHVFERTGDVRAAEDTFRHYWHPANISAICEPVDIWIGRDSYSSLLTKGVETIRRYADLKKFDDEKLLALEYEFIVPLHGTQDRQTGEPHLLAGTVDRLAIRRHKRHPTLSIDDHKTGKQHAYLRHNIQGTAYAYASTLPEFWTGWQHTDGFSYDRGIELFKEYEDIPRKFTWINLTTLRWVDGGYRGPKDYQRLTVAVQRMADSIQADIFPLNIHGEICQFCPQRNNCAGIGVDDNEGAP